MDTQFVIQGWQLAIAVISLGIACFAALIAAFTLFTMSLKAQFDELKIEIRAIKEELHRIDKTQAIHSEKIDRLAKEKPTQQEVSSFVNQLLSGFFEQTKQKLQTAPNLD